MQWLLGRVTVNLSVPGIAIRWNGNRIQLLINMLTLSSIFWTSLVVALISFWWQGDLIKSTALKHLHDYFRQQDLQLLDQTIVLKGVWPHRSDFGSLQLRRRYGFEFTSTGEERYHGLIELSGRRLQRIELEPHIMPDSQNRLQ